VISVPTSLPLRSPLPSKPLSNFLLSKRMPSKPASFPLSDSKPAEQHIHDKQGAAEPRDAAGNLSRATGNWQAHDNCRTLSMSVTCEIMSQQALGRSSSTTCTYNMPVQALVDSGNVIDVPIDCCQCVSIAVLITSLLNVPISKA